MTSRTRFALIASTGVLVAGVAGLVVTHQSQPVAAPGALTSAASTRVVKDTGLIAVDAKTGNLRSDLGWVRGDRSAPLGVVYCVVGTETSPVVKRVLLAPNGPIVGRAAYIWSDCSKGFAQWDSVEAVTHGKWPASVTTGAIMKDAEWRDGLSVVQGQALNSNKN